MQLEDYQNLIAEKPIVTTFFSGDHCGVCDVVKPLVERIITNEFPQTHFQVIDIDDSVELCGQFTVFSLPTVLIHVEGKEHLRLVRNFFPQDVRTALEKPYRFLFGSN